MRGRKDKVYCSDRCRFADWAEGFGEHRDIQPCRYCGVPADSVDHVPPQAYRPFLAERGLDARYPFVEVWSCRECNSLLGARALWTVQTRKRFIKQALRRRYARYLRIPEWSDAEIGRTGRGLQRYVLHGLAVQELTERRLAY